MKSKLTVLAIATVFAFAISGRLPAQQPNWAASPYANPGQTAFSTAQVSDTMARTSIGDVAVQRDCSAAASRGCTDAALPACGGCGDCGECEDCCRFSRLWGGMEYLMLWTKGRDMPVLVRTTEPAQFGGAKIGDTLQGAGRVTIGAWLDDCDSIGIGTRFLGIQGDRTSFDRTSNANSFPTIVRPFFNTDPNVNAQDALFVSFPGLATGNIAIRTSNDVYSSDTFLRINMLRDADSRWDLIGGYHFTLVDDGLTVQNRSTITGGVNPVGSIFDFRDAFNTRNEFHGGEIGVMGQRIVGMWTLNVLAKLSVGRDYQTVTINGQSTVIDVGGGVSTTPGGLLTQPTNIGTYNRTKTVFVPEAMLSLNRKITNNWDLSVGYSFIGWSSVLLAGDQIDRSVANTPTVNASQLTGGALNGPANPRFTFNDTAFWLNAISFGVNYRY